MAATGTRCTASSRSGSSTRGGKAWKSSSTINYAAGRRWLRSCVLPSLHGVPVAGLTWMPFTPPPIPPWRWPLIKNGKNAAAADRRTGQRVGVGNIQRRPRASLGRLAVLVPQPRKTAQHARIPPGRSASSLTDNRPLRSPQSCRWGGVMRRAVAAWSPPGKLDPVSRSALPACPDPRTRPLRRPDLPGLGPACDPVSGCSTMWRVVKGVNFENLRDAGDPVGTRRRL